MHFLSHLLHVCYFSILVRLMNGYLLFAANFDDFRAIAKKLQPEILGESLARIAKPYLRENLRSDSENSEEVSSSEIVNDSLPPIKGKEKHPPIKGKEKPKEDKETFDISQNTFDELVERVKERLAMELKPTYLNNIRKDEKDDKMIKLNNLKTYNNKNVAPYNMKKKVKNGNKQVNLEEKSKNLKDQLNTEEMSPFVDAPDYKEEIFNKPKVKQEIKATKTVEQDDYEEAMPLKNSKKLYPAVKYPRPNEKEGKEMESTTDPSGFFEKIDFTQNDSYEDYVKPAKEHIYASSENISYKRDENQHNKNILSNKRYKINTNHYLQKNFDNNHATVKTKINKNARDTEKSIKPPNNYDYKEKNIDSEEIKAKTENLWYDNNERVTIDTVTASQKSKKSKFGTKLPTRDTFRMVTPNFMANFPLVVEKYNFDEPIPEKDRERESLKYIGNPPASINKKVQLL
ncbi:triadin-like [Maniola jurtina]|uniref:triadin-like n=1 Tax=Maniola jurtina TaxID=191418 RepID=UPI001E68B468|nr:triadin-like [Maniola jurtina]